MRLLRTIAALSAVLTPLMAEAAFSRPMPGTTEFPRASNPQVNVPVCFIETTSGTTLDLVSLCGTNANPPAPPPPPNTAPAAANPTNAPNAGNPATPNPNGITRDAAGTPTTTPAGTNPANPNNPNNPNNVNPGTAPTNNPNVNPGTAPTNNPNVNPGTAPTNNPNNTLSPGGGTAGDGSGSLAPNPSINLPRIPPSSFGPGGVAPTRDAIDGQRR